MTDSALLTTVMWPALAVLELLALLAITAVLVATYRRDRRARQDSRETRAHFDLAADASGIGLWSLDLQSGRLVWDDRMFALYGRDRMDFQGAYAVWSESVHPDDRADAEAAYRGAIEGARSFDTQFRIVRPDGTIRHLRAFAEVLRDQTGQPARIVGTNTDVTEQAEVAERLTKVTSMVPGAVFQLRRAADGREAIPFFSGGLVDGLALEPDGLAVDASAFFNRVHPDWHTGLRRTMETSARTMTVWTHEFQALGADPAPIWLAVEAKPERLPDGAVLWHGVLTDVSERRAAQRQRDALAAVVAASDDIIVIKDLDLRVVATNQAFATASGHASVEALIGRTDAEIFGVSPDSEPVRSSMADDRHAQTLPRGEVITREEPVVGPDGTESFVLTRKYPIYDAQNVLIGTGNISVDITQRRVIEAALAESERRFRDIAETLVDWVWEIDTEWRYTYVAGNVQAVLGYEPEDLIGRSIFDFIVKPNADTIRATLETVSARGDPIHDYENWNRNRDGTLVCLLTNGVAIRDASGSVIGYRGTDKNITEQRLFEAELRLRDRALEATPNGVVITRADGDMPITYCNSAFERITGYSREEIIGWNCRFLHGSDRDQPGIAALRRAIVEGRSGTSLVRNYRKDGTRFWNQSSIAPITDDSGRITHFVGVQSDVTETKRQEEELRAAWEAANQANLAKSQFLANMSHELRTPLNAIMGFSQMFTQRVFGPLGDPHYDAYAQDILASGDHLLALINDLLDMAKIESGRLTLVDETLDVGAVIASVVPMIQENAVRRGLTLNTDIAADLPALRADGRGLKQMLINLLSNALKFTPAGGTIAVTARADASGAVTVEVSDTGVGIAADELDAVLEPFQQGQAARASTESGTGLGLSLVKALIDRHGGTVHLSSVVDAGTVVSLRFPADRSEPRTSPGQRVQVDASAAP